MQPPPLLTLPSEPIEQEIERLPSATRRLAAQLRLPLAEEAVWQVLTDYESLPTFIPNLVSSRLLSRDGSFVKVEQVGSQKFVGLSFSASVRLELQERCAEGILGFRMVSGDFRRFEGAWTVVKTSDGVRLRYELLVPALGWVFRYVAALWKYMADAFGLYLPLVKVLAFISPCRCGVVKVTEYLTQGELPV